MKLKDCHNISDLRKAAEKRLPAAMFHYIDGAAGDEWTIKHNTNSFEQYEVIPNYLVDVDKIDTSTKVLGAQIDWPYICCLLYTSPSPRDKRQSRMPSSA